MGVSVIGPILLLVMAYLSFVFQNLMQQLKSQRDAIVDCMLKRHFAGRLWTVTEAQLR